MHVGILSEQLRSRGHQVVVLCRAGSEIEKDAIRKGMPVFHFAPSGYLAPWSMCRLLAFLRRNPIDLIHAHYSKDLWTIAPVASLLRGKPIVFIKHIGTQKAKKDPFHRWIYRRISYTTAVSQVIADNLLATHPIGADRVGVIHHGLDLKLYQNLAAKRQQIRGEFGIAQQELLIGTIGRLQEGKGHLEFLEMAGRISKEFPHSRFMIIGEPTRGEEQRAKQIYDKIARLGLGKRLILAGFRNDIPAVLAAMDIFAFPSHAEAFGLVVIEAMAAKLPVVSSNCDGVLDIIDNEHSGLLVEAKNVEALTAAVRRLLLNENLRQTLAQAARSEVERRFTIERMVDEVERVYARCLKMNA